MTNILEKTEILERKKKKKGYKRFLVLTDIESYKKLKRKIPTKEQQYKKHGILKSFDTYKEACNYTIIYALAAGRAKNKIESLYIENNYYWKKK